MKKLVLILGILTAAAAVSGNMNYNKESSKKITAQIYYVDRSMLRLVPVDFDAGYSTPSAAAKKVVRELIEGEDYNRRILRLIPDVDNCMSVRVEENTAYVNLKEEFTENMPENKNHELLMLYSIVNSVTSIDGIDTVKFLFEGKEKKETIGGIDMREIFIPDYYI